MGTPAQRGYQYVPDVGGAVAIMYNAQDRAGRKVDYLHLSRQNVARIFIGDITSWADPAISADNKGLLLPDQPINVIYRGGQSGTTALFYDYRAAHRSRVVCQLGGAGTSCRRASASSSSMVLPISHQRIRRSAAPTRSRNTCSNSQGLWSIAYDEAAYGVVYNVPEAWVQNASGAFVQPYAQNISAALESAHLRADLSQDLSAVYTSANPLTYPISAYSYLVTQCARAGDRPTCAGPYTNSGVTSTLAKWMRYIACEGQVSMARNRYSPLPPNLSQEMANSIGRMQGTAPEQLSAANCANPRFKGSLGDDATSPPDPLRNVANRSTATNAPGSGGSTGGGTQAAGATPGASTAGASPAGGAVAAGGANAAGGAAAGLDAGVSGATNNPALALGGTGTYRSSAPVVYNRPTGGGNWPTAPDPARGAARHAALGRLAAPVAIRNPGRMNSE